MIASEDIEPTAAKIIGELYRRCEKIRQGSDPYKDVKLINACASFWYGMHGLQHIAIALDGSNIEGEDGFCVHFNIAMMNEMRRVHRYIESITGLDADKQGWI